MPFHPVEQVPEGAGAPLAEGEPIAVIGVACRFPGGADTPEKFWALLVDGRDGVRRIDRWNPTEGSGLPVWGATLDAIDEFDAAFFGIQPKEAARMDPQHRLLLEVVWEALENAGQPPDRLHGSRSGVFVGIYNNDYAWEQNAAGVADDVYAAIGSGGAIAANRVSYLFDLRGPSLAVDTTCSSSLVATHLAVQSLRRRESDLSIAAGVNLTLSPVIARSVAAVIPIAPDGYCKAFDGRADGIVRGEGCAAIVLKRLSDASRDADPILAVIAGSAVNQDGRSNGLTAPSLIAQQDVIRAALADAALDPATISYVEAHGTGTALGDPVEWEALDAVVGRARASGRCLVGSVKANIGHCEAASGIAGLLKVILALQHRRIPVQPHFDSPNPRLANYGLHLIAPTSTVAWSGPEPRRGGVSAFSVGGTNAHVIVEEAAAAPPRRAVTSTPREHVLPISARSPAALRQLIRAYIDLLDRGVEPHDLCFSAARKRSHLPLRAAVTGHSAAVLRSRLANCVSDSDGERAPASGASGVEAMAASYERGQDVDWSTVYPDGRAVRLPNYPWQRQRYWFTAPTGAPLATPSADETDDRSRRTIYQVDWVDAGASPESRVHSFDPQSAARTMSAALGDLVDASGFSEYLKAAPVLEQQAGRAIEAALYRDGWRPAEGTEFTAAEVRESLGVRLGYERLFARVLEVLAEDGALERAGSDRWRAARPLRESEQPRPGPTPAAAREADLLRRCVDRFCETLRGECNPLELLFPDGGIEQAEALFSDSAFARLFNGLAARAFASVVASAPRSSSIRVLEIGGGTGGTTAALLGECPTERTDYVFTDVSSSFFSRARRRFGRFPFVTYRILDIESDPRAQGFEGQQFDIVVAAHVLHATADLRACVRHARALLSPGGVLLLVESTARQRLTDFTYGLTPGWWKYADEDVRGAHPLVPAAVWCDLLRESGFVTAISCPEADEPATSYGAAVIVAKTPVSADVQPARSDHWVVVGDARCAAPFREALELRGGSTEVVASIDRAETALSRRKLAGVIHVGGIEASCCEADTGEQVLASVVAACRDVISTAQVLERRAEAGARLWLITRAASCRPPALAQAPLDAIGAVIAREFPGVWGGSVDLEASREADCDAAIDAVLRSGPGAELALRGGRVMARAVVPVSLPTATGRLRFDPQSAYLITGGFGGMGLRIAEWMARRGAGCVVLAGRRGATPDSRPVLEAMGRQGTTVVEERVDVSEEAAVRGLLARIGNSPFTLRGVIHAAGVFEDQLLARHDWDYFRRVFLPKAVGAWNLHRLTSSCTLDHFVLFSSAARYLNATGLANYAAANAFLDALAEYRRARALPAMSIAWAGWTGTGMARALPARRVDQWERLGVRSLEPAAGLDVLESLIAAGEPPHAIVMDLERPASARVAGAQQPAPAVQALPVRLAGRPTAERERIVRDFVSAEAARIMDTAQPVPAGRPLADLGFDSLMALELRNTLAGAAGRELPASLVFDYPTVDALAARLVGLLCPGPSPTPDVVPATTSHSIGSLIRELDGLSEDEVHAQLEQYARSFLHTR